MPQPPIEGVTYIEADTKSRINRWKFDTFGFDRALKEHGVKPDLLISLQNIGVGKHKEIPQIIYAHQSIPLYPYKWNLLDSKERLYFFYKNVYPFFVRRSLSKNVQVFVQIPFMREGWERVMGVKRENIHVIFPDTVAINKDEISTFAYDADTYNFVYPATIDRYKNHKTLIAALGKIKRENDALAKAIRIHLTIFEDENPKLFVRLTQQMRECDVADNFVVHGRKPFDELLSMYKGATGLLYPSKMESLGLPLVEAASVGVPIVASDLDYAHDVVGAYEGAEFVPMEDAEKWAHAIVELCSRPKQQYEYHIPQEYGNWDTFFDFIDQSKACL